MLAMLAELERLFSGAKITILDRRNRFKIHTLEALECLKSWLKISPFLGDKEEDEDVDDAIKEHKVQIKGVIVIN
jgi:hypothetical protein